jgi:hypothetical protein
MTESFVDLSYRGLSLGRRIKLAQMRPTSGYLEHPTPMPVGTTIGIATDTGVAFEAVVTGIHEQVGGTDRPPGMTITPALASPDPSRWWSERVTLPDLEAPPRPSERARPVTVRPRSHTVPQPIAPDAAAPSDVPVDVTLKVARPSDEIVASVHEKRTRVMDAVDQELLEQLTREPDAAEALVGTSGEHAIVDDGKRTTMMDAVDLSALGLDAGTSGAAAEDAEGENGENAENGEDDADAPAETASASDKKPKKRRKKRR